MERIQCYCKKIWAYFDAVGYFLLRAYRYPFYRYYLKKLSTYPFLLCEKEMREPTKADFDAFRDKYGFSEEMMGLLVHILHFGFINDRAPPFYGREYQKWYSQTETLKVLLSRSLVWEKLQTLKQKCPADQDLEKLENAIFQELMDKRFYLNIPLK